VVNTPNKIYAELDKLSANELYIEFGKIKDFVHKKLAEIQRQKEEEATELQSKIERIGSV